MKEEIVPERLPKEKEQLKQRLNKKYKIILVAPSHIVIEVDGFNRFVNGDFKERRIGDFIELAL